MHFTIIHTKLFSFQNRKMEKTCCAEFPFPPLVYKKPMSQHTQQFSKKNTGVINFKKPFQKCAVTLAAPRFSGKEEQNGRVEENNRQQAGELHRYTTAPPKGRKKAAQGHKDKTV